MENRELNKFNKIKFYEIRSPHKRTRDTGILEKDCGGKKSILHQIFNLQKKKKKHNLLKIEK
ncbi:MAG: hypothetical protein LBC92_03980 [Rickettsiales bacterium]|jgi:hypothetical protein|nr:hypothetical protein [Rickettsiales bacterium]